MIDIFNEMESLKKDILFYMTDKKKEFDVAKSTLNDVSKFCTIEDFTRMTTVLEELKVIQSFYLNARNFLVKLEAISKGFDATTPPDKLSVCVGAYLVLKSTDEYRIIVQETSKIKSALAEEEKSKGLQ